MGNIVDLVGSPLSALEVTLAVIFASITRSIMISFLSIFIFSIFIEIRLENALYFAVFLFLSSFSMGAMGFIAGMWSDKWENMATVTNFIIVPMSFLSGTFYSINRLPAPFDIVAGLNPIFYAIDGFRYGMIGLADRPLLTGFLCLCAVNLMLGLLCYRALSSGYRLKS